MPTFDRPAPVRIDKATRFVADRPAVKQAEFIGGGFDFDMSGGLRRDEILNRSTDEARQMVETAKAEADAIRQAAYREGFDNGQREGYEAGLAQAAPLIESFTRLAAELSRIRSDFYAQAESEMIDLVMAIARTVFGLQVEIQPELVRSVILAAVDKLQSKEELNIKIAHDDMDEAEKVKSDLSEIVENIAKVHFSADPNLVRGGCVVETTIGSIDARIETQLEAIRESFKAALAEERTRKGAAPDVD
jgi:flagellar assembly protein FliH